MNSLKMAVIVAAAALGLAAPAKADVIFDYVVTGNTSNPKQPLDITGSRLLQIVITDEAYASGYTAQRDFTAGVLRTDDAAATRQIYSYLIMPDTLANSGFNIRPDSSTAQVFIKRFSLTAAPYSAPVGQVVYRNDTVESTYQLSGSTGSALFGADDYGLACTPNLCNATLAVVQSVPEPASIALFGAGLLGLAGVMRRRAS